MWYLCLHHVKVAGSIALVRKWPCRVAQLGGRVSPVPGAARTTLHDRIHALLAYEWNVECCTVRNLAWGEEVVSRRSLEGKIQMTSSKGKW